LFGKVAGFERKAFAAGQLNEYFLFHNSFLFCAGGHLFWFGCQTVQRIRKRWC
jgi:hypothetical protein